MNVVAIASLFEKQQPGNEQLNKQNLHVQIFYLQISNSREI